MDFGLSQDDMDEIIRVLQKIPTVDEALIFGSRAKGNYKKGSDVDIAVKGKGIDLKIVASLSFLLNEESSMPYFFDIIHFEEISEKELLDHINRVGQCIYSRESGGLSAMAATGSDQEN